MTVAISPDFTDDDFPNGMSVEDKVAVFADRVRGWQLEIAEQLSRNVQHSGFGVLSVVFSYFEMLGKYLDGSVARRGISRTAFRVGLRNVFPELGDNSFVEDILWNAVRNGLYHSGLTQGPILITDNLQHPMMMDAGGQWLMIRPRLLVETLQSHFSRYVAGLLDPSNIELRRKFEKAIDGLPQKTPMPMVGETGRTTTE